MTNQPDGYLAIPESGSGPGVLVLHAWWGLNDTFKTVADRLAEAGFVAFAADLAEGQVAKTIEEAEKVGGSVDERYETVRSSVGDIAQWLVNHDATTGDKVGILAFSLGAYFGLFASNARPDLIHSVVTFYGAGSYDFAQSQAAYQGHFAENDPYEGENVDDLEQAMKDAGRPVEFFHYPGTGHWFFEPDRPEYNEAAAKLAWERTLNFLQANTQ